MFETHHLHWQTKVQPGKADNWGQLVSGIEDIEQAIRIIVLTPKLSVPAELEKFCDALNFMDRPPAIAIPEISREIWDALTRWEPRIVLDNVEVTQEGFHHFKAVISYHLVEDVEKQIRQADIDLLGQTQ